MTNSKDIESLIEESDRSKIDYNYKDLLRNAEENWDDIFVIYEVLVEAAIRLSKNSSSKAKVVIETVAPRYKELINFSFPPVPDPALGDGELSDKNWPQVGLLKHMGYSVAENGPGKAARRNILHKVFTGPLPNVQEKGYMEQWGGDGSLKRMYKMAWSIATFANNRIRSKYGERDSATDNWVEDLAWLRKKYYEGFFDFPWPELNL